MLPSKDLRRRPHGRRHGRPAVRLLAGLAACVAVAACRTTTSARLGLPPPAVVADLNLGRYMGTWFEIARFDERFQRGCQASRATYSLLPNGQVEVVNACHQDSVTGPTRQVRGRARRADPADTRSGRLEVSFFRPFWAHYWVVDIDPAMTYAVVGHPSRDHLWVLSRTPQMAPDTYAAIVARMTRAGFPTWRLQITPQPGDEAVDTKTSAAR